LTENKMTVKEVYTPLGQRVDERHWLKSEIGKELLRCAILCNNVYLNGKANEVVQGSATEVALFKWARQYEKECDVYRLERVKENPFSSVRKMMSVVCKNEKEWYVYAKGAPEILLERCALFYDKNKVVPLTDNMREAILYKSEELAHGKRLIAFAGKPVTKDDVEEDGLIFYGMIGLVDPLRKEIKDAVKSCKNAGIRVIMITGDHPKTAESIAKEAGIIDEDSLVVTGVQLTDMGEREFEKILKKAAVFARVTPEDKLRIVTTLQKQGHIVAMSGDGVNDAPAIKKADIGVAMGDGSAVTKEAAQMVLADNNFATIVGAIEEGRGIYSNIRKFIRYLLACNVGEVLTMLLATLLALPIPLLPIQILWINLVTDGLPAMALGIEPKERDLMQKSPRAPKESIFSQGLWFKILTRGVWIAFITLSVYILLFSYSNDLDYARTGAFATLVMAQLFYVLDCRSEKYSVFELDVVNKYLFFAVAISVGLQVVVTQWSVMNPIFKTVPLDLFAWALIVAVSSLGTICYGMYRKGIRMVGKRKIS